MKPPKLRYITGHQLTVLTNGLAVAMQRFRENSAEMREAQVKYEGLSPAARASHDEGMIHGRTYKMLADQMELQATEIHDLLALIDESGELALVSE